MARRVLVWIPAAPTAVRGKCDTLPRRSEGRRRPGIRLPAPLVGLDLVNACEREDSSEEELSQRRGDAEVGTEMFFFFPLISASPRLCESISSHRVSPRIRVRRPIGVGVDTP